MSEPPVTLGAGGARLWAQLVVQDGALEEVDNPLRSTAAEACRAQDRCDALDAVCRAEPAMLEVGDKVVAHPAWVEARQQSVVLARLIAALRLPDEATGKRPQRRQTRGAYGTPPAAKASPRERLRAVN